MIQQKIYELLLKHDKDILYEDLKEKTSIGFFIETIDTTRKDILGNETLKLTFSIFYKINANDTLTRLKANKKLNDFWEFLKNKDLEIDSKTQFKGFKIDSLPTLNSRDENGSYIYQIILSCAYKIRKEN